MNTRTKALLGEAGVAALARAHVAIFGVGGVGGYVAEGLARSGVGTLTLVDGDLFSRSNLNRQLFATTETIGQSKVTAAAAILATHAPDTRIIARHTYLSADTVGAFPFDEYDYVVDAVDDVAAKLLLAEECARRGILLLCAMGAGNKLDPTAFCVSDLSKTKTDPLARVLRRELGRRGLRHVKVVYSEEPPRPVLAGAELLEGGRRVGSVVFAPAAMGMAIAGAVVTDLCGITEGYAPCAKREEAQA